MTGRKIGFAGSGGEAVPGTGELAIVAAVDAVADGGAQCCGNFARVFDGEIRNAAARVQPVGGDNGAGGAGAQTGGAGAAMVGRRLRRVDGQRQVGENFAQKEKRTEFAPDEQRVLAAPAQLRPPRQFHFQHGGRIDENAKTVRGGIMDAFGQLLQAATQGFVIVAPQRVAGNIGGVRVGQRGAGIVRLRPVRQADADGAQRAGQQFGRTGAHQPVARHIIHAAVKACVQPGLQP